MSHTIELDIPEAGCIRQARPLVIIESPFGGTEDEIEEHIRYARHCMRDSLLRGETPFASHLLYPQENILNEFISSERRRGINSGYEWGEYADLIAFYTDKGISKGMQKAIIHYQTLKPIEFREVNWDMINSGRVCE